MKLIRSRKYFFYHSEYIYNPQKSHLILICDVLFKMQYFGDPPKDKNFLDRISFPNFIITDYEIDNNKKYYTYILKLVDSDITLQLISKGIDNIREYFFSINDIDFYFHNIETKFLIDFPREIEWDDFTFSFGLEQ